MKKIAKISAIVLSLVMAASALGACNGGVSKTSSDTSSKTESSKVESSKTESSKVESSKTESSKVDTQSSAQPKDDSADWKQLYIDRLGQDDIEDYYRFALIRLDDNDIPELIVNCASEAEGNIVMFIPSDEVEDYDVSTNFAYRENTGEFMTDYGIMGLRVVMGYKLLNGVIDVTEVGESNENDQLPQPEYKWNEEDVTKDVFDENVATLSQNMVKPDFVDKAAIIDVINNY